jgi:hypothetical protein
VVGLVGREGACPLEFHNALLKKTLGRGSGHYRFAWGTVDSEFDARSGGSSINICYVLSD